MKTARIQWHKSLNAAHQPPHLGSTYSTVARFEALRELWPQEAWSVVIEVTTPLDSLGSMRANIRLLFEDRAPPGLLDAGSKFDLFEGQRCVASGEIV